MLLGQNNAAMANNNSDCKDGPSAITLSARLINDGRYAEAWLLLSDIQPLSPAGLFNMALCNIYAGEFAQALSRLRSAFDAAERLAPKPRKPVVPTLAAINERQNSTDAYLYPVGDRYSELFPDILKENIMRLTIDCHAELEQWPNVIELGTPMRGKFANVDAALEKAAQQ